MGDPSRGVRNCGPSWPMYSSTCPNRCSGTCPTESTSLSTRSSKGSCSLTGSAKSKLRRTSLTRAPTWNRSWHSATTTGRSGWPWRKKQPPNAELLPAGVDELWYFRPEPSASAPTVISSAWLSKTEHLRFVWSRSRTNPILLRRSANSSRRTESRPWILCAGNS